MNQTSNHINNMNEIFFQTFLIYHYFQETNFAVDVVEIWQEVCCLETVTHKFFDTNFFSNKCSTLKAVLAI